MILPAVVTIPAGRFRMGSPDEEPGHEDSEHPMREVTIARPFAIGRLPVSFAEWDEFADATGGWRPPDEGFGRGAVPAMNLSWNDAQAYLAWLRAGTGRPWRLPSEAEWEYAARAGTQTAWHWGEEMRPGLCNCLLEEEATSRLLPSGRFPANSFGLHDMHGQLWEWVEDCWNEFYLGAPSDGSPWLRGDCGRRVLRGGSWLDVPRQVRAASRNRNGREFRCNDYGFRIACDLAS